MRTVFLSIIAFFLLSPAAASGQSTTTVRDCSVRHAPFPCPANLKVLAPEKGDGPFVGLEIKANVILFAEEISEQPNGDKLILDTLDAVFQKASSARISEFKVKESDDFWGTHKYSRYEESKGARVAFYAAKQAFVGIHYSIIAWNGKRFLIGNIRPIEQGVGAEARFNKWIGGGGEGDAELQNLIIAITGESKPKEDLPGGPPPAMAPKKP